jgi:hypothetical protein
MLWILSPNANQEIMVPLRFASRMTGSRTTSGESGSRTDSSLSFWRLEKPIESKTVGWKTFSFLTSF